jgi:hypothetical protein
VEDLAVVLAETLILLVQHLLASVGAMLLTTSLRFKNQSLSLLK